MHSWSLLLELRFVVSSLVWVGLTVQPSLGPTETLVPQMGRTEADLEPLYARLLAMPDVTHPLEGAGLPDMNASKTAVESGGLWCRSWVFEAVIKEILRYAAGNRPHKEGVP